MLTASVVIVTYRRPDCVRQCLEHLSCQEVAPLETIVIDASEDDATAEVVSGFAGVQYVRNLAGRGHMTNSRNVGLRLAAGDVVAFIDDDAYAEPQWLGELLRCYIDGVGGVGGRALNPGVMPLAPGTPVGRLLPDGRLVGNFDVDTTHPIDVDHLIGCNMSFRRSLLQDLGGLFEAYPGTEIREDTDAARAVAGLGHRLLFNPRATVLHVGAPHAKGRRFDLRYRYYANHNHVVFLARHEGLASRVMVRFLLRAVLDDGATAVRAVGGALVTFVVRVSGLVVGLVHARSSQAPSDRGSVR